MASSPPMVRLAPAQNPAGLTHSSQILGPLNLEMFCVAFEDLFVSLYSICWRKTGLDFAEAAGTSNHTQGSVISMSGLLSILTYVHGISATSSRCKPIQWGFSPMLGPPDEAVGCPGRLLEGDGRMSNCFRSSSSSSSKGFTYFSLLVRNC